MVCVKYIASIDDQNKFSFHSKENVYTVQGTRDHFLGKELINITTVNSYWNDFDISNEEFSTPPNMNPDSDVRNSNKGDILKSTNNEDGNISEVKQFDSVPKLKVSRRNPKYVQHDLTQEPLNIDVVNCHTNLCIEFLPSSMITNIQENDDINTITFDDGKKFGINKFSISIDEKVMNVITKLLAAISS
ncbi:hypothetical protein C2G38_2206172 [Gigaspora rosea]|uniref:Uncharacterized protein n=1 Tax=Gigaspora rosea TaxID=44941 RepID=A0A397UJE5_9GLOM|nr:hypothetical protein C2G38_2206172 [Gigaspora rosea]